MIVEWFRFRTVLAIVIAMSANFLAVSSTDAKARSNAEEARIGLCIKRAAGGRPWLEKTLWGLRDQEGGWVGAQVANSDGSHDLGPLQVNSWWVGKIAVLVDRPPADVRHWLVNEPCFNVDVARWIFLNALSTSGSYWRAVGIYHSPTAWRQKRYTLSVSQHLRRRFGPTVFAPVAGVRP